ncbi:hypothetical protein ANN_06025 [Periplaneta americana]|uniref:Tc3 transposase DNA binding domain-containing protein n=1 Tax=Periplaneta americana TaxID=6978 RepID=A0ABQ8TCH8_PERAM|nr:hypothetical protein ANN_06025 [Periplaneta americana]
MRPEDVARAVALYDDGRSVRYIANVMNMARSTTRDAIKRYRETLEYTRRPSSGRPRATNPNEDSMVNVVKSTKTDGDRINGCNSDNTGRSGSCVEVLQELSVVVLTFQLMEPINSLALHLLQVAEFQKHYGTLNIIKMHVIHYP